MTTKNTSYKPFSLGQIVATRGVVHTVPNSRLLECLGCHVNGDWGIVGPEDAAQNDQATHEGFRILSAYPIDPTQPCNSLWIITEADRSVTTFLLPEEY